MQRVDRQNLSEFAMFLGAASIVCAVFVYWGQLACAPGSEADVEAGTGLTGCLLLLASTAVAPGRGPFLRGVLQAIGVGAVVVTAGIIGCVASVFLLRNEFGITAFEALVGFVLGAAMDVHVSVHGGLWLDAGEGVSYWRGTAEKAVFAPSLAMLAAASVLKWCGTLPRSSLGRLAGWLVWGALSHGVITTLVFFSTTNPHGASGVQRTTVFCTWWPTLAVLATAGVGALSAHRTEDA